MNPSILPLCNVDCRDLSSYAIPAEVVLLIDKIVSDAGDLMERSGKRSKRITGG
jgi:hypothetical protein